jgi:hypoxanthine phosphoribosyltransferase
MIVSMRERATLVHPDIERVLIDEKRLQARIAELGLEISRDYQGRELTLIGILKGGVVFLGDLLKSVTVDCAIDFMSVSSYAGKTHTGVVRMLLDLRDNPEDKDLLVVEDIMDTGLTLGYLLENLATRKPRSLEVCALLDKPECRKVPVKAKYVGFKIPEAFVVGYGLDFNEKYRNLPYVGVLRR